MAQPTALLILPTREPAGEERDAAQATARILTESLEDLRLAERASRATGYMPLRGLEVTVRARLVILAGRVTTTT
jgi:hypothetical protein